LPRGNTPRQYAVGAALLAVLLFYALRAGVIRQEHVIFFSVLIPSIILHEVSHGAVALLFGDRTAQRAGRLTLNPIAHIDPFWTVLVPAVMVITTGRAFGMAKPVPVNPRAMRSPRNHGLLTSLAGPATNIALAAVATVVFRVVRPHGTVAEVVLTFGLANVILAAFNLLPIPPLDGSAVPERLLPRRWLVPYMRIRQYSFFVFIGLFFIGGDLLGQVLDPAVELWIRLLTG
jgi:Zn-dependent protease